jgi:hypothetical protein
VFGTKPGTTRSRRRLAAAVVLTICAATAPAARTLQDDTAVPRGRLNPRIAAADRERYKSVQDAKAWLNPYLVIGADGIEVIAKSIPSGRKTVAAAELRRTLIELPVDAWPYGRVAGLQDTGLRAADQNGVLDRNDEKAIHPNHQAAATILKALGVLIELWPSA